MNRLNKILLPATIIIASLILGGFFYASQVNKQKSIERQQEINLQEDRRLEEAEAAQAEKEYIAKRKNECYSIYEKERDAWNNVRGVSYSEARDICIIKYESTEPSKSKEECEKIVENTSELPGRLQDFALNSYLDCLDNLFRKEF